MFLRKKYYNKITMRKKISLIFLTLLSGNINYSTMSMIVQNHDPYQNHHNLYNNFNYEQMGNVGNFNYQKRRNNGEQITLHLQLQGNHIDSTSFVGKNFSLSNKNTLKQFKQFCAQFIFGLLISLNFVNTSNLFMDNFKNKYKNIYLGILVFFMIVLLSVLSICNDFNLLGSIFYSLIILLSIVSLLKFLEDNNIFKISTHINKSTEILTTNNIQYLITVINIIFYLNYFFVNEKQGLFNLIINIVIALGFSYSNLMEKINEKEYSEQITNNNYDRSILLLTFFLSQTIIINIYNAMVKFSNQNKSILSGFFKISIIGIAVGIAALIQILHKKDHQHENGYQSLDDHNSLSIAALTFSLLFILMEIKTNKGLLAKILYIFLYISFYLSFVGDQQISIENNSLTNIVYKTLSESLNSIMDFILKIAVSIIDFIIMIYNKAILNSIKKHLRISIQALKNNPNLRNFLTFMSKSKEVSTILICGLIAFII